MKVFIMRGLPGAGKSRYVKNVLEPEYTVFRCSADDYHTVDGVYNFDPSKAKETHDYCLHLFLDCINSRGIHRDRNLVVDNTNTQAWEIAPYYRLAEVAGYEVEIIWLRCHVSTSTRRNVHKVPEETIAKMADRLEREILPQWWKQTVIMNCN